MIREFIGRRVSLFLAGAPHGVSGVLVHVGFRWLRLVLEDSSSVLVRRSTLLLIASPKESD